MFLLEMMDKLTFKIENLWDSFKIDHDPVTLMIQHTEACLKIDVVAPFFNSPASPNGESGKAFDRLWDYEVVEAFFLNKETEEYLEIELCPHGQHLVLMLKGFKNILKSSLELEFRSKIEGNSWFGQAEVPWHYFPVGFTHFNAYAIHGVGDARKYEALHTVPNGTFQEPNFHRLEYFEPLDTHWMDQIKTYQSKSSKKSLYEAQ